MKVYPYGKQEITDSDIQAVVNTLKSEFLTQGPKVMEFEKNFANYVGARHATAVANGTAALHLSVLALGIKAGQKVITTPITFAASANAVLYAGGEVSFVDIDSESALIDLNQVEDKLKHSQKGEYAGVIAVNFAGKMVNLELLRKLCDKYGIWLLEDACHAPGGSSINSVGERYMAGSCQYSHAAIFSFHPVKHIATGEGGMVTTNDLSLDKKVKLLRTHGITKDATDFLDSIEGKLSPKGYYYEMQDLGFNYRISDINCALGISQLRRADENLIRRRRIAETYFNLLDKNKLTCRPLASRTDLDSHAFHLFVILVKDRDFVYDSLREKKIYTQVHYIPVHLHPYYRRLGWKRGDFPKAEKYFEECLSLPMYPGLEEEDVHFIFDSLTQIME